MTKKLQAAVKESFFKEHLVPVGQLAELYTEKLKKHSSWNHKPLSQLLFDNLGLVSVFAISPATAADAKLFNALSSQLEHLKETLKEDLKHLNANKVDASRAAAFRSAASSLAERINPQIAALRTCIKFSNEKRGVWLDALTEAPTALTRKGRCNKWRTLTRNMDFQANMAAMGLGIVAKGISLGSHQGREELPELWHSLFHTDVNQSKNAVDNGSGYLPAGVTVHSNAVGALVVSSQFDPKKALKKTLKDLSAAGVVLPAEINQRLVPVDYSVLCGYHELPDTVKDVIQWKAKQTALVDDISKEIVEFQKTDKLAKVRAKLQKTFSEEDLQLLAEAGDLKLASKPAPSARASKTSKPVSPRRRTAAASA